MPKKKLFEWHCMECAPESSDDEVNIDKRKATPDDEKPVSFTPISCIIIVLPDLFRERKRMEFAS